jgi:hypothetical protein
VGIGKAFNLRPGPIYGHTVGDYQFEVVPREILGVDRFEQCANSCLLVIARDNNGDRRHDNFIHSKQIATTQFFLRCLTQTQAFPKVN